MPGIGETPNALISSGRFVRHAFEVSTPIKLSFDETAVYENLDPSESCPYQGFFYGDDEDETLH